MFDLRKQLLNGALVPTEVGLRQALLSISMAPFFVMPGTYPSRGRPAGYRAHRRWKQRRAAGRA